MEVGFIGDHAAGFAESNQVLAGIKTKTAGNTQAAGLAALIFGAMGLAGIFDDRCAVASSNGKNGIHVRHLPENVDGNDGLSSEGNGGLQFGRIQSVGILVDVDKDRARSAKAD